MGGWPQVFDLDRVTSITLCAHGTSAASRPLKQYAAACVAQSV